MIPVLIELGLLECSDDHRVRVRRDNGETVCVTCETNLGNYWRRGLARLAESYAAMDVAEAKGAWFEDHEFIMAICREKAIRKAGNTTTRTNERVEVIDGKEVAMRNTVTTVRDEWIVDGGLLRLLGDVRDKMTRMAGLDVTDPTIGEKRPNPELHVHERTDDGDSAITN